MRRILPGTLLPVTVILGLFFALRSPRPAAAQLAAAGNTPLQFGDNFFVTGDYVVAGAYGMTSHLQNGFATGTISFPDTANKGIKGPTSVPEGAQIVAALLYWQTAEKVGQTGTGQKGFFRPVFSGGPTSGYPITGMNVTNHSTVSFSSGGCSGTSTGKILQTYRAEVRAFLPQDANGNVIINSNNPNPVLKNLTFEVRLPSVGNSTPLTLGASLVLIYRVLDPNVPLNSIVLYDGAFASTSTTQPMTQTLQGMYDASATGVNSKASVAYIVGSGQGNKFQDVYFNGTNKNNKLPSLYGNQPDFPGWYGTWDNVRWNFPEVAPNTLSDGQGSVLTQVSPSMTMPAGCVSAAAIIVSTTVENKDGDGLLDSWKNNGGYCDASFNEAGTITNSGACVAAGSQWVSLPNAHTAGNGKDVYVQLDYMCYSKTGNDSCDTNTTTAKPLTAAANAGPDGTTTYAGTFAANTFPVNTFVNISGFTRQDAHGSFVNNGNFIVVSNAINQLVVNNPNGLADASGGTATFNYYSFDPRQVTDSFTGANAFGEVMAAYSGKAITLHPEWHAMQETAGCQDSTTVINGINVPSYCAYLNQPGMVLWKGGFDALKGQPLDPNTTEAQCQASPATCVRRFQHGRKDSYHEVIFGHAQGGPEWSFQAGTLTSVVASGNMVTFTTKTPHGLDPASGMTDQNPLHRVTVSDAITNTILNGTYLVQTRTANTFTIQIPAGIQVPLAPLCPTAGCTALTDPRLSVTSGRIHTRSGFSDIGGADSLVTLGRWDPSVVPQVTGSTFMHEFGHANSLTHSGYFYDGRAQNANDYRPTVEANCKPNFQSVMNYPFQLNLLDTGTHKVVDYSEEQLNTLNEQGLGAGVTGPNGIPAYPNTLWYAPTPPTASTARAKFTCDGFTVPLGTNGYLVSGPADPVSPAWNTIQDINFNLTTNLVVDTKMRGHSDWTDTNSLVNGTALVLSPAMDLRQVGATGADAAGSGGSLGAGGGSLGAGGGSLGAGGGSLGAGGGSLGAGGGSLGAGGGSLGAGGGSLGAGGGSLGAGGGVGEIDFATATGVTFPPSDLTATEGVSPRTITLNWVPGFGLVGFYKVYRSDDGGQTFNVVGTVNAPATQFVDNPACKPTGYQYFVTAVQSSSSPNPGQESGPSNTVTNGQSGGLLTGCYAPAGFLLSAPASAVHGTIVSVTFTVLDDFNVTNSPVNTTDNQALVTLIATGPLPGNCGTVGPATLLNNGLLTGQSGAASTFPPSAGGHYTFNWDTDGFCAGQYALKLSLDSTQNQTIPVRLSIDVTDSDNPHITTTAIQNGVVGTSYSSTISEDGGVTGATPFVWALAQGSSQLPSGLSLGTAPDGRSGLLSGIPTAAGAFNFIVQVTDAVGNVGTQTLTMTVTTPVAQINQALVPDSAVPGSAQVPLTLNGTGFGPGSKVLWNGIDLGTTTFVSNRRLTATIPVADVAAVGTASVSVSNPVTVGNQRVPNSNVDFFQVTPTTSASLSKTDLAGGNGPRAVIAADFDGDGKLDLAIANNTDNTISILTGNGDGTFTARANLATGNASGSGPGSLVAGDFNSDGKLDLAFANFASGAASNVSVFLGNGDGSFQTGVTYGAGSGPFSLVTADFDRDGKLDLAVVNTFDHTVSILLGNGDGTFQTHVDYAAAGGAGTLDAADVALGDFNGDGKLDLAVTNPSTDKVSVLLGNGDGKFQNPVGYLTGAAGSHPIEVAAADFNGDGKLDLAVTNLNTGSVAILMGNGIGTFQAAASYPTTGGATNGPTAITTGDFNGDGVLDVAVTDQDDNSVSILLGNGNGTFQTALTSPTGAQAAGVAAGDFNGDGRLDVAVANFGASTVSILLQRPEPASNLAVTGATASRVDLSWTASPSTTIAGYNIYRSATSGSGYSKVNSAIVTATVFTDISVDPGATYFYVVTAVDAHNLESINSNEVTATTPPQPPTNLAASNVTASQVPLSWTASTTPSVVSYNVYRSTTSGSGYTQIGSATGTGFTDTTVSPSSAYFYVVTAVGPRSVESVFSNEAPATTPAGP